MSDCVLMVNELRIEIEKKWTMSKTTLDYSIPIDMYQNYYNSVTTLEIDKPIYYFMSVGKGYFEMLYLLDMWKIGKRDIVVYIDEPYVDDYFLRNIEKMKEYGILSEYYISEQINGQIENNIPRIVTGIQIQIPSKKSVEERIQLLQLIDSMEDYTKSKYIFIYSQNEFAIKQQERFEIISKQKYKIGNIHVIFFMPNGSSIDAIETIDQLCNCFI